MSETTARARRAPHPAIVVGAAGLVTAVLHVWWVHRIRQLGAFNVDEVGYMATGLRYHRSIDPARPLEFVRMVAAPSSTGPLVPLLTVPFSILFGRSMGTQMLVQPLLVAVAAAAVAGIASSLADRRAGIVAGLATLGVPALIQSARGFQYATAAGACLCLALWALLASDRGHRRWPMVGAGVALGCMLLARTMAIGFVPAVAVAAAVLVRRDRRSAANLGIAAAVALAVAGPWWFRSRSALWDYLVGFGYGETSQHYGSSALGDRVSTRLRHLGDDLRLFTVVLLCIAAVAAVTWALRRRRTTPGGSPEEGVEQEVEVARSSEQRPPVDRRGLAAVGAALAVGFLSLLSTRNQGVWFEVPMELLILALAATALVTLGRLRPVAEGALLAVAAVALVVSLTDTGGDLRPDGPLHERLQITFSGGLIDKQRPLADADPALLAPDRADREAAARRWWRLNEQVAETLDRYRSGTDDGFLFATISGNSHLLNGQSILLAQELGSLPLLPTDVPDTAGPERALEEHLAPTWRGTHERLLVVIRSRSLPFPEDRDTERLLRLARQRGWEVDDRLDLPDGGDVLFLRLARR